MFFKKDTHNETELIIEYRITILFVYYKKYFREKIKKQIKV